LKFDEEKISKLVSEIFNALNRLKELADLHKKDFVENTHMIASAKYFLIVAIEASLDICNHIISRNRFRIPEDYADTFRIMGEEGILDKKFVEKLIEMARFRNRLVHIYWEVDDEMVYNMLQEDIQDIEKFIQKLTKALHKKSK